MKQIFVLSVISSIFSFPALAEVITVPTVFTCTETYGNVALQIAVVKDEDSQLLGYVVTRKTSGPANSNILLKTIVHEISRMNTTAYNESTGAFYIRFENNSNYAEVILGEQKQSFKDLSCTPNSDLDLPL